MTAWIALAPLGERLMISASEHQISDAYINAYMDKACAASIRGFGTGSTHLTSSFPLQGRKRPGFSLEVHGFQQRSKCATHKKSVFAEERGTTTLLFCWNNDPLAGFCFFQAGRGVALTPILHVPFQPLHHADVQLLSKCSSNLTLQAVHCSCLQFAARSVRVVVIAASG